MGQLGVFTFIGKFKGIHPQSDFQINPRRSHLQRIVFSSSGAEMANGKDTPLCEYGKQRRYFLVAVESQTLKNGKAKISRAFWQLHRKKLCEEVCVLGIDKAEWRMTTKIEGWTVYLVGNWIEFCERYSIRLGHTIIFKLKDGCKVKTIAFGDDGDQLLSLKPKVEPESTPRAPEIWFEPYGDGDVCFVNPTTKEDWTLFNSLCASGKAGKAGKKAISKTGPLFDTTDEKVRCVVEEIKGLRKPEKGFTIVVPSYIKRRGELEFALSKVSFLKAYGTKEWVFVFERKDWNVKVAVDFGRKCYRFCGGGWAHFKQQPLIVGGVKLRFHFPDPKVSRVNVSIVDPEG